MTRLDRSLKESDDLHWSVGFGQLDAQALLRLLGVTYVHASPDCSTFSNLATSVHRRKIDNNFLGASPKAWEANGLEAVPRAHGTSRCRRRVVPLHDRKPRVLVRAPSSDHKQMLDEFAGGRRG